MVLGLRHWRWRLVDDIAHPPLELILTCEEEIGMGGVQAIHPEWLTAPAEVINLLDSEDEGELFIGCAFRWA